MSAGPPSLEILGRPLVSCAPQAKYIGELPSSVIVCVERSGRGWSWTMRRAGGLLVGPELASPYFDAEEAARGCEAFLLALAGAVKEAVR